MTLSLYEAKQLLLSGAPVSWTKFGDNKAGSVKLSTAAQRRLLHFLLSCDQSSVSEAHEKLFDPLIAAWKNDSFDPAKVQPSASATPAIGPWRLARLETSGFGGLNLVDGPIFDVPLDGLNWCLEGQNGSGKTSLASAVIWALTGYRCRDHEGLVFEDGARSPVHNKDGHQIGDWPSITSYPPSALKLAGVAETWARATFHDPTGNTAQAHRRLVAAPGALPTIEVKVDSQLLERPQLLEVGLLMPARLARIGFGEGSESIYEAVKLLTGLDQLSSIAEGATNFSHKSKRFLKYASDNGAPAIETKLELLLQRAAELAATAGFDLTITGKREEESYAQELVQIATVASDRAAACLSSLATDVAPLLDIKNAADRTKIKMAVSSARAKLQESTKGVSTFEAWRALREAQSDAKFPSLKQSIDEAHERLREAIVWDARQAEDQKLRLKAIAASFIHTEHANHNPNCPLCDRELAGESYSPLVAELADLKAAEGIAERKLEDVCAELKQKLDEILPRSVAAHFELLSAMQPRDAFISAVAEVFVANPPFSTVLVGMAALAIQESEILSNSLPTFTHHAQPPDAEVAVVAQPLVIHIGKLDRLAVLASWWQLHVPAFVSAWQQMVGIADEVGKFPLNSLEGKLASLEAALDQAAPLDEIAKNLSAAAVEATKWLPIHRNQKMREQIAEALVPVKDLRLLVAVETAASITSLSGRMKEILERIHFRERLTFQDAELGKKSVHVAASFDPGILIDASVVANSSWLRAIMWAFVLALREQSIKDAGTNSFPLMVLDDPQVTFDPRNKRKWAEEIARLGNRSPDSAEAAQIIVISHERQFFQMLVNSEKLTGKQGLVVRLCEASRVATVIYGDSLARAFKDAETSNDDEKGHLYVQRVRTYLEDLLKIMLRFDGPGVSDFTLDELVGLLKTRRNGSVPPFTNPSFEKLLGLIGGPNGGKPMQFINEASHKFDGTLGVAQAVDVRNFWEDKLQSRLHTCFKIFAEFDAHVGEPRLFSWMESSIELPAGNTAEVKSLKLEETGIAAAAKSDGRAGDGLITVADLSNGRDIVFHNHDMYQLAAGTLDPVADVGDVIIVSNYAKVHPRCLVVTSFQNQLLARRFNEAEIHPHIAILTGQATDPTALAHPVIAPKEQITMRKVVGTVFCRDRLPIPHQNETAEFVYLADMQTVKKVIQGAKLFGVSGRSAEPIALDGQFIMTQPVPMEGSSISQMDGKIVIAFDDAGARYLKRFRLHGKVVVLESLNSDGFTSSEVLALEDSAGIPKLTQLLEVVGVLFESP